MIRSIVKSAYDNKVKQSGITLVEPADVKKNAENSMTLLKPEEKKVEAPVPKQSEAKRELEELLAKEQAASSTKLIGKGTLDIIMKSIIICNKFH